jgi:hypothetical protein
VLAAEAYVELAGVIDPAEAIRSEGERQNGLRNLLGRVADRATKYLHRVWKDYRSITIRLVPSGDKIEAFVEDKYNTFNLSRRSDGFKRFMAFLLTIGARVHSGTMKGSLLLYDEPDMSLHRQELGTYATN